MAQKNNFMIYDEFNYTDWESQTMAYLWGKDLWGVVTTKVPRPEKGVPTNDKQVKDEQAYGKIWERVDRRFDEQMRTVETGFWARPSGNIFKELQHCSCTPVRREPV